MREPIALRPDFDAALLRGLARESQDPDQVRRLLALAVKLVVPHNITIVLLPPKCPELNPQENVWQFIRDNWLSNRVFDDLHALIMTPSRLQTSPPTKTETRPTRGVDWAQAHRFARHHLFEDRVPLLSRRTSPNDPSENSMVAPVDRLPQASESHPSRVGQMGNAKTLQSCACPSAFAGVEVFQCPCGAASTSRWPRSAQP